MPQSEGDQRPVIVLDPGHGGIDPGAAAPGGFVEKDIVFGFAQKLRSVSRPTVATGCVMTRDEDVFVPLGERVRIARAPKADLFISIHADTISGGQEVQGPHHLYRLGARLGRRFRPPRRPREQGRRRPPASNSGEGADDGVPDILQELTLRETRAFSHGFAGRLSGELDSVARLNKNPHRQAGFRVLRAPDVPSVLIELGYLSSRKDLDLLSPTNGATRRPRPWRRP